MNGAGHKRSGKRFGLEVDLVENLVPVAERLSAEWQQRLSAELGAFWQLLRRAQNPRLVLGSGTRVDVRGTLRSFLRSGGMLTEVRYHEKLRQRQLTVLVDCNDCAVRRDGLMVLIDAILRVDPAILVLGFDREVFPLYGNSIPSLQLMLRRRSENILARRERFLDMLDLDQILRQVIRFAPGSAQRHLLMVSDMFLHHEARLSASALSRLHHALMAYRKTWLIDTWMGAPFVESENGSISIMSHEFCELLGRSKRPIPESLDWRVATKQDVCSLEGGELARLVVLGDHPAPIKGRRFTPYLRELGFVRAEEATASARLIHVPHSSCQDFGDVFWETRPM